MSVLCGFDPLGNKLWSKTVSPGSTGPWAIDYLGNGSILGAKSDEIVLIDIEQATITKTLQSFGAVIDPNGIAVNHSRLSDPPMDGDGFNFDGQEAFITVDFNSGASQQIYSYQYQPTAKVLRSLISLSSGGSPTIHCCAWDGHFLYTAIEESGAETIRKYDVANGLANEVDRISIDYVLVDMAFDEQFLLTLDTIPRVRKWAIGPSVGTLVSEVSPWNPGLTNCQGLTTDSRQYIISATSD